jgi:hypothetical protein
MTSETHMPVHRCANHDAMSYVKHVHLVSRCLVELCHIVTREHLETSLGDPENQLTFSCCGHAQDGLLELRTLAAIRGDGRPVIRPVVEVVSSKVDHGFCVVSRLRPRNTTHQW